MDGEGHGRAIPRLIGTGIETHDGLLPIGKLQPIPQSTSRHTIAALMQGGHYLEIILPGATVGVIVGFATQRFGALPAPKPATG